MLHPQLKFWRGFLFGLRATHVAEKDPMPVLGGRHSHVGVDSMWFSTCSYPVYMQTPFEAASAACAHGKKPIATLKAPWIPHL